MNIVNTKSATIFTATGSKPQSIDVGNKPLENLVDKSKTILLKTKTVFPFTFFPDTLIIDLEKLSVIRYDFFFTKRIYSIDYQDIDGVVVEYGPIFATLVINSRVNLSRPIKILYLDKSKALSARRLIQGLMLASKNNVSLDKYKTKELLVKSLEDLGATE